MDRAVCQKMTGIKIWHTIIAIIVEMAIFLLSGMEDGAEWVFLQAVLHQFQKTTTNTDTWEYEYFYETDRFCAVVEQFFDWHS